MKQFNIQRYFKAKVLSKTEYLRRVIIGALKTHKAKGLVVASLQLMLAQAALGQAVLWVIPAKAVAEEDAATQAYDFAQHTSQKLTAIALNPTPELILNFCSQVQTQIGLGQDLWTSVSKSTFVGTSVEGSLVSSLVGLNEFRIKYC